MILAGRPEAVRRHVLAPLRWLPAAAAVVLVVYAAGVAWASGQNRSFDRGFTVEARVDDGYGRREPSVPVTYRNPRTGRTEATLHVPEPGERPRAGEVVTVEVDRADPHDVALEGERVSPPVLWEHLLLVAVPVVAAGVRRWGVWRVARLAARPGPSFALAGVVDAPARPLSQVRPGRRANLHLFPLDAGPDQRPLCTVPLLSTNGIPVGEPGVEVEVKGSVRPFGRLALRVGGAMLWPRGRALAVTSRRTPPATLVRPPAFAPAGSGARDAPVTTSEPRDRPAATRSGGPADVPPPPPLPAGPASDLASGWRARPRLPLWLLTGSCLVGAVATAVTLRNRGADRRLERDGTEVVVTVTGGEGVLDRSVPVEYRMPGVAQPVRARVVVDYSVEAGVGDRYPAVADPGPPPQVRLLAVPYDPVDPLVWAWLPAAVPLVWLLRGRWRWRAARRRIERLGPPDRPEQQERAEQQEQVARPAPGGDGWVEADAWVVAFGRALQPWVDLAIAHPASPMPSCLVRLTDTVDAWREVGPTRPVRRLQLAGVPGPGEDVLLRWHDAVVVPQGPARTVDRDDPYVPRPGAIVPATPTAAADRPAPGRATAALRRWWGTRVRTWLAGDAPGADRPARGGGGSGAGTR